MDPTLDEIVQLSGELQAFSRSFASAGAALREQSEGGDPQGGISVVLDGSGRVTAVRPSARWTERIQPEQLGGAVLQAVQAAQGVRLERWAEAARSEPSAPAPAPPEPTAADGPPIDVMSMVDELTTAFDALGRFAEEVSARPRTPIVVPDELSSGDVEVSLSGLGEPVAVRVNRDWARRTNLNRLSERLLEAFERAYAEYDAGGGARPQTGVELSPQLKAVAANPVGALLRYAEDVRASLT